MNEKQKQKLIFHLEKKMESANEMLEDNPNDEFWLGVYSCAKSTLHLIKRGLK